MTAATDDRLLTTGEVAERCRVSDSTARYWRMTGYGTVGSPGGISPPGSHRSVRNSLPLYGSCRSGPGPCRGCPDPVSEVGGLLLVAVRHAARGFLPSDPVLLPDPPQQVGVDAVEQLG